MTETMHSLQAHINTLQQQLAVVPTDIYSNSSNSDGCCLLGSSSESSKSNSTNSNNTSDSYTTNESNTSNSSNSNDNNIDLFC